MFFKKRILRKFRKKIKEIKNRDKEILKNEKNKISCIFRHDIKTALLAQIRSIELLLSEKVGKLEEAQKEILSQNLNSNYFLLHLIINTLFLLNYDNDEYKLNLEDINLTDEINDCLNEIKTYAVDKEQNIVIKAPKNIKLNADRKLIKKIIFNILTSSISYGFEKSDIEINIKENKNSISFSTKNKSAYMTKEKIDSLFSENKENLCDFNQLGMSLNLNIAKKLIIAHNWNMIADSKKDNSSTFGFVIEKQRSEKISSK